jgi:KIX domain
MASTPPPQQDNHNHNNENDINSSSSDWRASVAQSYRNAEVRDIAGILASFEPGAKESSKLMLAMRFEDAIFKAAGSLADYRKLIAKRLKKVQKSYAKKEATPHDSAAAATNATEELMKTLRTNYGEALRYIVKHAEAAVQDVEAKSGTDRSHQLKQHTDSAVSWAKQLGIYDGGPEALPLSASEAAAQSSEAQLKMLQQHLERRVDNIRLYVVKHVDPDLFLVETVEKKDRELKERANRLLSMCLVKLVGRLQDKGSSGAGSNTTATTTTTSGTPLDDGTETPTTSRTFDAHKALQEALEKAQASIPPPTRRNNSSTNRSSYVKNHDVSAALIHSEKMRAASSALVAYFGIPDRQVTAPRNSLQKIMTVVKEGAAFVTNVTEQLPQRSIDHVTLSDAWSKVLELPLDAPSLVVANGGDAEEGSPPLKRLKVVDSSTTTLNNEQITPRRKTYTTARVLLMPNRKTPSNLIPALRRKRAQLVRPPHGSRGSHLILEFNNVFSMTVYLSPLVVTLRAMTPPNGSGNDSTTTITTDRPLATTTQLSTKGCAPWIPLYHGLTNRQDLSVWGVSDASYESVGRVVEERLRDASMQATQLLRRCFGNHVKDKTVEFEVELLEASALLEFLHVARTTYMPNWQDDDGDDQ